MRWKSVGPLFFVSLASAGFGACSKDNPRFGEKVEKWGVTTEVRIGSIDAPDEALTRVGQVLIGPQEEFYVSQPEDLEIRVYDADGKSLETLGREGEGPGEFRSLSHMGMLKDGLFVGDDVLGRISLFAFDGRFLKSLSWVSEMSTAPNGIFMPTTPQVLLPDSTALVNVNLSSFLGSNTQEVFRRHYRSPILRVDRQGRIADTLVWREHRYTSTGVSNRGGIFRFACPFNTSPLYELMADGRGVVVVERSPPARNSSASFSVTLVSTQGDTVFSKSHPYQPLAVTALAVGEAIERIRRLRGIRHSPVPDASAIERALIDAECIPSSLPPVTAMMATQDGTIWLRREAIARDSVVWNILDETGTLVGVLQLPKNQTVAAATEGVLAVTEEGEFEVPYVVRYRLERG